MKASLTLSMGKSTVLEIKKKNAKALNISQSKKGKS